MQHRNETTGRLAALARAHIDPIVGAAGFRWNDGSLGYYEEPKRVTALYEAAVAEFEERYPDLWPGNRDVQEGYPCIDLWIEFNMQGSTIEASLEGQAVDDWLRANGHGDLGKALGHPAEMEAAIRALATGLQVMLAPRV
jgi:hypothetical protein